jgi:hypothetical protein
MYKAVIAIIAARTLIGGPANERFERRGEYRSINVAPATEIDAARSP